MFKPNVVVIDYETALLSGEPSVDYHRPDFRAVSAAFAWYGQDGDIRTAYFVGEDEIRAFLQRLAAENIPLIAHNAQFEIGVTVTRFPDCAATIAFDTQRLLQNADNGVAREADKPWTFEDELAALDGELTLPSTGLSLQAGTSRWLSAEDQNHKEPFYTLIRSRGGAKGREGSRLDLLTPDELEQYNVADVIVTLKLYTRLMEHLENVGFKYGFDHLLHLNTCRRIVASKIDGVPITRDVLQDYLTAVDAEMADIKAKFRERFKAEIERIEARRMQSWVSEPKTERGRQNREGKVNEQRDVWEFNPRSTKQLKELFVDELKISPQFWTKESKQSKTKRRDNLELADFVPNPSFKASHLTSYGEGGEILQGLKKRQLVARQCDSLLKLSEADGRWHIDIRACGTATNRLAGGGGGKVRLNVQGLARRDKGLMSCIVPDDGYKFYSIDLASGEPTVTTHFSQDKNYYQACFGMVGKTPFYDENGILQIDDIYLMGASKHPAFSKRMLEAFNATYGGLTFAEKWCESEQSKEWLQKKELKDIRPPSKVAILGIGYGQQPKGMVLNARDNGFSLNLKDAKAFHYAYWNVLFPGLRDLERRLQAQFRRDGHLVTTFGYRLVPKEERLCFNYWIQAHVSGIIKVLEEKLYAAAPYLKPVVVIHDELFGQIPDNKIDDGKQKLQLATDSLNKELNWSVNIRTGYVIGANAYEAK